MGAYFLYLYTLRKNNLGIYESNYVPIMKRPVELNTVANKIVLLLNILREIDLKVCFACVLVFDFYERCVYVPRPHLHECTSLRQHACMCWKRGGMYVQAGSENKSVWGLGVQG